MLRTLRFLLVFLPVFGLRRGPDWCPLYPNKRTSRSTNDTSEKCQHRKSGSVTLEVLLCGDRR